MKNPRLSPRRLDTTQRVVNPDSFQYAYFRAQTQDHSRPTKTETKQSGPLAPWKERLEIPVDLRPKGAMETQQKTRGLPLPSLNDPEEHAMRDFELQKQILQTGKKIPLLQTGKKIPRRRLFQMAGAGAAGTILAPGGLSGRCEEPGLPTPTDPRPPLGPGARIELTQVASTAIVQKATQLAAEYLQQYGGCAQCTLAALQDALPFLPADPGLFRAASCLDGGATPSQLHQCGSFTAAGLTIGYLCGRARDEIFFGDRSLARQLLQKVFTQFQNHYGGVLCKEVRGKVNGDCRLTVSRAAQWTAETLLETFAGYKPPPSAPESPSP